MAVHSQILHQIHIKKLKNISDVSIDFENHPLTAIMGVNGSGKSTILYALSCVYKPVDKAHDNYKFSRFFPPTNHFDWSGSDLSIIYSYGDASNSFERVSKQYKKQDRWAIYARRPERYVNFIGIKTCVPVIETENKGKEITYTTSERTESLDRLIREKAGLILNKNYDSLHNHEYKKRTILGVKSGETQYSALTMGAGEQRVFTILDTVFRAPNKHSLILIDELDLLMHPEALKKLIDVLLERATDRNHQIIFTSHNTELFELKDKVQLLHIHQTGARTVCMLNTTPDITRRMTGEAVRSIEVYVEDDLAEAIVRQIASSLGISRDVVINKYGAAINVFTVSGGLALSGQPINNALFILDGDVYTTDGEKTRQIEGVLTGHGSEIEELRRQVLESIKQFNLGNGIKPEEFLFKSLDELPDQADPENEEIRRIASNFINPGNHHNLVNLLVDQLGGTKESALTRLIRAASLSPNWLKFSEPIRVWLEAKKNELHLG